MLTTANGTNTGAALDQQRRQFEGQQRAYNTLKQGGDDYNRGWQENTQRTDRALNNYSEQAIRGNAPYVDPQTGGTRWLPYGAQPGQVYSDGRNSYVQDQQGTYYQWQGNGWVMMQPAQQR